MHRARGDLPLPQLTPRDSFTLRRATADDEPFLRALYASTRADEMAAAGWDGAQRAAFLDLQFRAQQADYTRRFSDDGHRIVEVDGRPVGRLWTAREDGDVVLVDIALLPEHRGRGVGTALLQGVFTEANREGTPVRLTVAHGNTRAAALFQRLGCERVGKDAFFAFFERRPRSANAGS